MRGVDEFVLRGAFEELVLRVLALAVELTAEQRALGERALSLLRFELRLGSREARETAAGLARSLGVAVLPLFVPESSPREEVLQTELLWQLELELGRGRLLVEARTIDQLSDRRDFFLPELPPLPPPPRERLDFSFELRVVDEIGRGVPGVDADFSADEPRTVATNAAGVALLEGVRSSTASVARLDPSALSKALAPRWSKPRPGAPPKEGNSRDVLFRGGAVGGLALKAAVSNRVVLKPPRGKLHLELFDKRGRVRHGERPFSITGPESFSGTTDEQGHLLLEVFPGDYELSLTLDFFQGDPDATSETVITSLVVQEQADTVPQRRLLGAVPRSVLARLHFFFNTNKAFLLPTALPAVKKLRDVYVDNAPSKLLVVGHADTAGGAAYNDRLSLDRARATIAYLKDDVDAWLKFYDLDDNKQRWGKVEDRLMITSMPDFVSKPKGEDAVRFFQRTRGLEVDGVAGPKTRTQLVTEYMALDGTSLRDFVEIETLAHGCGENFPLDDDGKELDAAPVDEKRDPGDRRVELFFFDTEFGVTPEPPGENSKPGSPQYPQWRGRVSEVIELRPEDAAALKVHFVEMADSHFRTNSAVVLPEGENPDSTGEHQALTSVGVIATALKFNDENGGRTLLVAGHTDTSAEVEFNQKLSNERAQVALALLKGGPSSRDSFRTLCNGRHTVADIKQILSWVSRAIPGFACDPGAINDTPAPASVRAFQLAYNENKGLLNPSPQVAPLDPDGSVGELTWGAFFDCYEFALKAELGVDDAALAALRQGLNFADPKRESLGFSEHFPIEELGVDGFRSQTNRRVEILFFESGEEPDLEHAANDPETSDLYLPGRYQHVPLGRGGSTPFFARVVEHETGRPLVGLKFELLTDTAVVPLVSDQQGILQAPGVSSENGVTLATAAAPGVLAEASFVITVFGEGDPTDLVPDPLVVTDGDTVVALTPHQVATGETLAAIAAQRGSTSDAIVTFHMGEASANAEQNYMHFVAGARHVDAAGTIVFQDDDQPGILQIPGPLALSLELGKRHLLRLSRVVVPFIVPKPPVYMRVLLASVDTFDSADMTVTAQGLVQGDLVRILEEISTEDNCKIRFVRVPPEKRDLHFFVRDIPIDTPEEWFPLVQNDVQAAAYADIEGDDQELNGEVNYFATEVFDEDGINNVA